MWWGCFWRACCCCFYFILRLCLRTVGTDSMFDGIAHGVRGEFSPALVEREPNQPSDMSFMWLNQKQVPPSKYAHTRAGARRRHHHSNTTSQPYAHRRLRASPQPRTHIRIRHQYWPFIPSLPTTQWLIGLSSFSSSFFCIALRAHRPPFFLYFFSFCPGPSDSCPGVLIRGVVWWLSDPTPV